MDFPYGKIVEPPPGFVPPEQWPEFIHLANPPAICARESVGTNPSGIRWSLWPLCFEEYVSDTEPDLAESKKGTLSRTRLVTWKRVARTDTPAGWRAPSNRPWRVDGFSILETGDHTRRWSKSERRHAHTWSTMVAEGRYAIEELSMEAFAAAYKKSSVAKKFGQDLLLITKRKYNMTSDKQHIVLYGVRNKHTGTIIAGTAVVYSPTKKSSLCESRFMLPEAKEVHAMTGLMDHWFTEAKKRQIVFLVFTYFWYPGADKKWKGFSAFKSHFCEQYIAYPPELVRFVRGKLW